MKIDAETIAVTVFAIFAVFAAAGLAKMAVRADMVEECGRMQHQIDKGHPVSLPDWCE